MKFNLLFFIRLLLRHIALLIAAPIILASLVFYLTRDQPKVYNSKARVYTGIASGSTIELDNTKLDFRATNTAYDNLLNLIKARTTIERVGLQLFAQHMALDSVDTKIISREKYIALMEIVPEEVKELAVKGDVQKTYENFEKLKASNHTNFIYELINLKHPDYSIEKIVGRISVRRILSSDFVDIEFESEDPAICQNTLLILSDVFVKLNADIKVNQSDAVVKYFQGQLNTSTKQLRSAEDELLDFNRTHNIINYYEQTKHIASEKEHFELEYQKVHIKHFAAKAVLETLESKLKTHEKKRLSSEEIIGLRNELADINFEISMKTLGVESDSTIQVQNAKDVVALNKRAAGLKAQLTQQVDQLYGTDYDEKTLASTDILTDWLENTIIFEGTKAQLRVMDQKRLEFEKLYQVFSPLGATMKRLERKIDIAEREYLSLLHSLGLAKLRQQNVELKSNLKLIEVPFFPINPKPSKRMILVVVAGLMGVILVAFTVLILEFLDGNINTATRAEDRIELKVSSIFPVIHEKSKKMDYNYLKNKAVNAISRNIILNQFKKEKDGRPVVNMFFSTQEGEGKTFICQHLISKLCELEYKTLHVTYDTFDLGLDNDCYHKLLYTVSDHLYKISQIEEFDREATIADFSYFDFIILEIPCIIKSPFPVKLAATMDYTFLVTRANRAWSAADKNALSLFNKATTGPEPTIILNGVKVLEMETVLGDLPKKRSFIRRWVKKVVQFRFFTKKSIA
ncbi:GumC family protein [Spongiimicrobium salis]|uniref:GumC family protein n=1 Tax=Spongiimicrobium salis TaxID=1667022 RepID=UPI00374DB96C